MFTRLIVRLLVRAVLSVGVLLGVASYGHHLSGGDPGALWKKVAGNALGGAARTLGGMRDAVGVPVGSAAAAFGGGNDGAGRRSDDAVWTWRDENGVTHYATTRPTDTEARLVTVDPDTNVLAPFTATPSRTTPGGLDDRSRGRAGGEAGGPRDGAAGAGGGGSMPGIAGAALRVRGDAPAPDAATAERLLRTLRQPSR